MGWKKKVAWIAGTGLLFLAALIAGLFLLIHSQWFAQELVRLATDAFNRRFPAKLTIQGATLRPFEGSLRLQRVNLIPDGKEERDREIPVAAEEIAIQYDPRALIKKRLVIEELYLFQPRVHLKTRQDGQLNLEKLIAAVWLELSQGDGRIDVSLENIRLVQGKIIFQDEQRELSGELGKIDFQGRFQIEDQSLRGILQAQGLRARSGNWTPQIDSLKADISLKGKELVLNPLEMKGKGLTIKIEGKLVDLDTHPAWEAHFSSHASSDALGRLFTLGDLNIEGPLQAKGRIWGLLTNPSADIEIAGPPP